MPPPIKLLKAAPGKEQTIEQLLIECGYDETLETFRLEKNKRSHMVTETPESGNCIEKKGEVWCCTVCDKTFTTKGSATRHLGLTHAADSKQFECPKCSSKFARRDDLYTHLRRMHDANQLVEMMIEERKAELKTEHRGCGKGQLMSVISHNEHLDVLLPTGTTICRPVAVEVSSFRAARACCTAKCNHWRVMHDGHEDVLVNGALHHKNDEGEWECHGELGNLDDFDVLLSTAQAIDGSFGATPHAHLVTGSIYHQHHHHGTSPYSRGEAAHDLKRHHHQQQEARHDFSLEEFDFFLTRSSS